MDVVFSGQLLTSALVLGAVYALVAIGLNLIYGTMRLLNIAHGEVVMLGGYIAYWAITLARIDPLVSIFVAMAVTALIGAVTYRVLLRRLLASSRLMARVEANSLLIFFGISVILQNLASLAFTANERSYNYQDQIVTIGDATITANRLIVLGVAITATVACIAFFRFSMTGSAIRALIQQPDAARLVGIDVDRTNLVVFCLGFAMAGLAGVLVSMTEQVSPFMGFPFTISAFVVIILGGLGNFYGGLIGAMLLAAVEVYGVALTSSSYRSILVYGVFIAILLLRPQGLFGVKRAA